MAKPPFLVITRPAAQGQSFLADAKAALGVGFQGVLSPILQIVPVHAPVPVGPVQLIFTSENGVRQAADQWPDLRPPAFAVGDRTAALARSLGYETTSASGNADDLALLVMSDASGPLVHVRGQNTTGDIAGRLRAAGREVAEAILYDQQSLPLSDQARTVLAGENRCVVPLFSVRSARLFLEQAAVGLENISFVAISPAVARDLPATSASVTIASRPDRAAMIDAVGVALSQ